MLFAICLEHDDDEDDEHRNPQRIKQEKSVGGDSSAHDFSQSNPGVLQWVCEVAQSASALNLNNSLYLVFCTIKDTFKIIKLNFWKYKIIFENIKFNK